MPSTSDSVTAESVVGSRYCGHMDATACTCNVSDCEKPRKGAHRQCSMHLARKSRHGNYDTVLPPGRKTSLPKYRTAHLAVTSARGRAVNHQCVESGCEERATHWAYDHTDPDPVIDQAGRIYSLDVNRYKPMCVPHHATLDRMHGRQQRTTVRHVEVSQELWDEVRSAAAAAQVSAAAVVEDALRKHLIA